jgi:hypothetical protein
MEFIFLLALTFAVIIAADFSPLETGYNNNFEDINHNPNETNEKC